ncbi:DUF4908 domain-containing protein [Phenylobacterium sp. J367]|uniref:DUF4908 domain-containing protein n=1 Tax=Phenylobacterium sp. J367 TaxID=2898435 RepID=UPI0021507179|nr:DUF4908 domain-containing protein [Phenylobacterium sp. J367]MCR5877653.1 DUF4908 domain-containing protein [Phenylobacterium sp. J367]
MALCVGAIACAHPVDAAPRLKDGLFGRKAPDGRQFSAPPVARYVSEDGVGFTLDRTQPRPLLKFDNSGEVWALNPQPAPRGDVIYKNDLGQPVIRATRLGGVTVFTPDRPAGSAVALAGEAPPLRLGPLSPQALIEKLFLASLRASRAARRQIPFQAEASPASSALIGDAAMVTSEALVRMSRGPKTRALLDRVRRVQFKEGRRAGAEISQGALIITVAPQQGMAGRPSSERIVAVTNTPGDR